MPNETNFKSDVSLSEKVSKFLSQTVYPKLGFVRDYKAYEWNRYEKEQMNGVDVDMTVSTGHCYRIDEKGAFYYMKSQKESSCGLPTFSFELAYNKDGQIREGWFIDEHKVTDAYLLMWARAADRYVEMRKCSRNELLTRLKEFNPKRDFLEIEFMLISRFAMRNFLRACGVTFDKLNEFARHVITHPNEYPGGSIPFEAFEKFVGEGKLNIRPVFRQNVHFYFSKENFAEQPVNLIINKSFLKLRFARQHFFIKPDEQGSWDNYYIKSC